MKILVTGAAGFIGFHLCKILLERGDEVVGIDNINDYYNPNLKLARLNELGINRNAEKWNLEVLSEKYLKFKFFRMNLEDRENLFELFTKEKFDKVCNLAAQAGVRYSLENPFTYISSNIVGFVNILEACRHNQVKHLAYASSSSVYGNNKKMPLSTSDNVDHPISLYAATKKSNELMAHTYSHLFGLPTTGLRFFTVYGPWGRPDMALFLFTKSIQNDETIQVFNYGKMVRDFTYVGDIVEGVIRVLDNPPTISTKDKNPSESQTAPYKIYNIGNSTPVQLLDYVSEIEKNLNKKAKIEYLPIQPGDVPMTQADVEDLEINLNYSPNTSIQFGVKMFIKWYIDHFN
jgi:UDP-glucuronate 4-epimerase